MDQRDDMALHQKIVRRIEEIVEARLAGWPAEWSGFNWPGYTLEHTWRVRNLALSLARKLGADERLVELAALLHDIGKPDGEPHGAAGAARAEPILAELGFDGETRRRIAHIIENHISTDPRHPPENLAIYDADFIDANFGCVAFTRYITIRGGRGLALPDLVAGSREWVPRLEERRPKLVTDVGREIVEERYRRMRDFHRQLLEDWERGDGPALGLARYLLADAKRPSLARQMAEMEACLNGGEKTKLQPSEFLRRFLYLLQEEVSGRS